MRKGQGFVVPIGANYLTQSIVTRKDVGLKLLRNTFRTIIAVAIANVSLPKPMKIVLVYLNPINEKRQNFQVLFKSAQHVSLKCDVLCIKSEKGIRHFESSESSLVGTHIQLCQDQTQTSNNCKLILSSFSLILDIKHDSLTPRSIEYADVFTKLSKIELTRTKKEVIVH